MKRTIFFFIYLIGLAFLFANESTQVDSTEIIRKKIIQEKLKAIQKLEEKEIAAALEEKKIAEKKSINQQNPSVFINPIIPEKSLNDKKKGIEINLLRILTYNNYFSFSGTYSIFDAKNKNEYAFPVFYGDPVEKGEMRTISADIHIRHYTGNSLKGFYCSGFARLANLRGYRTDYYDAFIHQSNQDKISITKLGIGLGIGYRVMLDKNLYWGTGLILGKYISGESAVLFNDSQEISDDDPFILDAEFFKIGWAF